jgi:hypothetical protein
MPETSPQKQAQNLSQLEGLAKRVVQSMKNKSDRSQITGLLGELGKIRAHLKIFADLEATQKLLSTLKSERTLIRSNQTRIYYEEIGVLWNEIVRHHKTPAAVRWSLGWIQRILIVQDKLFGSQERRQGGPGRDERRDFRR